MGKIVLDKKIISKVKEMSKRLKFIGPINFQFMKSKKGELKLTEINARSSGGMGITINSGIDIPKLTYELIAGDVKKLPKIKEGEFNNFEEVVTRQKLKVVYDLDETLFKKTWLAKILFKLSGYFFKLSLKAERLVFKPKPCIILTGRNKKYFANITINQLGKYKVPWTELIMCPKDKLVMDWKKKQIKRIKPEVWLDDEK